MGSLHLPPCPKHGSPLSALSMWMEQMQNFFVQNKFRNSTHFIFANPSIQSNPSTYSLRCNILLGRYYRNSFWQQVWILHSLFSSINLPFHFLAAFYLLSFLSYQVFPFCLHPHFTFLSASYQHPTKFFLPGILVVSLLTLECWGHTDDGGGEIWPRQIQIPRQIQRQI